MLTPCTGVVVDDGKSRYLWCNAVTAGVQAHCLTKRHATAVDSHHPHPSWLYNGMEPLMLVHYLHPALSH